MKIYSISYNLKSICYKNAKNAESEQKKLN